MSAIAGVVRFDGGPVDPAAVPGMIAAMAHRGPDGTVCWAEEGAAFGHATLFTTRESLEEHQPAICAETGAVLVMDGRIDNRDELRRDLVARQINLRTECDAELVLAAHAAWGADFPARIDGDYVLAIWDGAARRVILVRDRMGARPLYYCSCRGRIAFASEPGPLLALPWVVQDLNEGMVAETLLCEETSLVETYWTGLHRLPPAHVLRADGSGQSSAVYWSPTEVAQVRYRRAAEYAEHYCSVLSDSILRQSRSHLPLACEVSGGLDSSGVFALADRLMHAGQLQAPSLRGFSLYFGDGSRADEIAHARVVARYVGRQVDEIEPARPPLEWYQDWARRYRDLPPYPNSAMLMSIHRAAADGGSRVLMTGFGGDEWSYGSPAYLAELLRDGRFIALSRAMAHELQSLGPAGAAHRLVRHGILDLLPPGFLTFARRLRAWMRPRPPPPWKFVLSGPLEALTRSRVSGIPAGSLRPRRPGHRAAIETLFDARRIASRESMNHLAAASGVECRDPMTSTAMVEFHFATPEWTRLSPDGSRLAQRAALAGLLPDSVRLRADKAEFSTTLSPHFDKLEAWNGGLVPGVASMWVKDRSEISEKIEMAKGDTNYGMAKWAVWGLFGCAVLGEGLVEPRD